MFEVSSEAQFSAAHHLLHYNGPCENVHGHNWRVRVIVRCTALNDLGIGIDFKTLKNSLSEVIKDLDHSDLNLVFDPLTLNPSSENIAHYIFKKMGDLINTETCTVGRIEVSETPGNTAAYFE
jgi:6-pyruvoyltetrahydropterin/6-carboxytetrahydropterin synthase